jgi:adenosylcobinamide-GDP ribazoletransferase
MKGLFLALQFLTIIPAGKSDFQEKDFSQAIFYFPILGIFLGLILWLANWGLTIFSFNALLVNSLLVFLLIILTGALHLDGLADTCDAIFSGKNKEEMLNILRDPHIGTIGVLSLIMIILLKISLLISLVPSMKGISLLSMCVLGRWAALLAIFLFPYARREGKAKPFFSQMNRRVFLLSSAVTLVFLAIFWAWWTMVLIGLIALSTFSFGKFVKNKIGGITGDTLGAMIEITEVFTLFIICLLQNLRL